MKLRTFSRGQKTGYALAMVLVMAAIAMIVLGGTVRRTATTAVLNERENQYNVTFYAAEAAVEKVVRRMEADYVQGQDSLLSNNCSLGIYQQMYPTSSDGGHYASYWSDFEFSDGLGHSRSTYVAPIVTGSTNYVALTGRFYGLQGFLKVYRVLSNAKKSNTSYNITNAVQQDMEVILIPVFQFAIFYNSQLEFTWAAPFTINGRVHANGPIYTGVSSSSSLTFNDLVTTTSTKTKKSLGGYQTKNMTGPESYNYRSSDPPNTTGFTTNFSTLSLPIGTNNADGSTIHKIIDIPPADEDVDSDIGKLRYYNKASMVLLVTNSSVTAIIKSAADDPSPANITANYTSTNYNAVNNAFPFLTLTNTFWDDREGKNTKVSQIDMYRLKTWAATNATVINKRPSDNPFNILYVADQRTVTSSQLDAVRLVNGTNLPSFGSGSGVGFTVATQNPLYIWGNYNLLRKTDAASTNTTYTVPASLVSDSLTLLSSSWKDTNSSKDLSYRSPYTNITVNAAILTGVVYTTGTSSTTFSGGVHNLPRLLENWNTSKTVTLNTSIVNFFASKFATNQFRLPNDYYNAPTRQFNFDNNFKDSAKQPPGTPCVAYFTRYQWASPPAGKVNYAMPSLQSAH